mmetsp:Transcript_14367/g.45222  ORF Transcript_14367/g.45222 Transcript_14367/m.45222 type:complete len:239 (+) Transcript_14367:1949-2665(+)
MIRRCVGCVKPMCTQPTCVRVALLALFPCRADSSRYWFLPSRSQRSRTKPWKPAALPSAVKACSERHAPASILPSASAAKPRRSRLPMSTTPGWTGWKVAARNSELSGSSRSGQSMRTSVSPRMASISDMKLTRLPNSREPAGPLCSVSSCFISSNMKFGRATLLPTPSNMSWIEASTVTSPGAVETWDTSSSVEPAHVLMLRCDCDEPFTRTTTHCCRRRLENRHPVLELSAVVSCW